MFAAGAAVVRTVAAVVRTVVFFTGTAVVPFTVVCAFGVVDVRDGGVTGVAGVAVVLGGPAVVVVVVGPTFCMIILPIRMYTHYTSYKTFFS